MDHMTLQELRICEKEVVQSYRILIRLEFTMPLQDACFDNNGPGKERKKDSVVILIRAGLSSIAWQIMY